MRQHQDYYRQRTGDSFLFDMYEVLDVVTSVDTKAYFAHASYF